MADILFVHDNFPAQFGQPAYALSQRGHRVMAIAGEKAGSVTGVEVAKFKVVREPAKDLFALARWIEMDLLRGFLAAREAETLRDRGFDPALIVGHPGWGETMFLKDVFPRARSLIYAEYYGGAEGGELGFDPEAGPVNLEARAWTHARNVTWAMPYLEADRILCPTPFQASLLPPALADRVSVIHEGVNTRTHAPAPDAAFTLADGRTFTRDTPLITFVSRKFEPLRGFHTFVRALPAVLDALPTAQVLMIGSEGTGYGADPPPEGWKARYLAEVEGRLDLARVHFTGKLPHEQMVRAVQASSAHVYYTYPYVLSWSLIEAMSCGALVIGSDTAPVRDVIQDGVNGLLGDFFDHNTLAEKIVVACRNPGAFAPLRAAARATVLRDYDLERVCLPAWVRLVEGMIRPA